MSRERIRRREFLQIGGIGAASVLFGGGLAGCSIGQTGPGNVVKRKPNVVFIFADQWRAQAAGYAGNGEVRTPNLDELAGQGVNFSNAVSCCPVCSPFRASLMTGRYPLSHGVFLNDVRLSNDAVSIARAFGGAGYKTGYIGKWHLDGNSRTSFIPRERRQGFEFWKAFGCTHNYNNSYYYGDENVRLKWEGYDAIAQTREAQRYIREHATGGPFVLFVSWGPPHAPYHTAPEKYKRMFKPEQLTVRPNVPKQLEPRARELLAGYYAHIAALDDCMGDIVGTLKELGIEEDTILVFTSDHGDMLQSHGQMKKQRPWDESIRVPFLVRWPAGLGSKGRRIEMPINAPDIMPTLLGLSGIAIPGTVEGADFSEMLKGGKPEQAEHAALICCPSPFGQWKRTDGGREYRGIRTSRYTYVRDLKGPWLLYDNEKDPYQLDNLCDKPAYAGLRKKLDAVLSRKLKGINDEFLPGPEYIKRWGYVVDKSGTVRYTN